MIVWTAFFTVVLIWGSTPLAIQWSLEGFGVIPALLARMSLGLTLCMGLVWLTRTRFPLDRRAWGAYLSGTLGILGAMQAVYWGASHIPSGWISVLFGLSPIVTGLFAVRLLGERFTRSHLAGGLLGLAGLGLIFLQGAQRPSHDALIGVSATLLGVTLYALSTVGVKRFGHGLHPLVQTTGSLCLTVPGLLLLWAIGGGALPGEIPTRALGAVLYLGSVATVGGFMLFYFVLGRMDAGKSVLVTLIAPVLAVWLGLVLNGERAEPRFLLGAGLILLGLAAHQWGATGWARLRGLTGRAAA